MLFAGIFIGAALTGFLFVLLEDWDRWLALAYAVVMFVLAVIVSLSLLVSRGAP